jgi:DNA-binding NarL/FixJ family response regulator
MTHVIVRSGVDDSEVIRRTFSLGALAFVRKGDDPERLLEAINFACGGEVLVARALCEVIDVDTRRGTLRVSVEGRDGWSAERSFDCSWCPPAARMAGGAFYAETYKRLTERGQEIVLRSAAVNAAEEAEALAVLLRPI